MTYRVVSKKGDVRVSDDFKDIGILLNDKRISVRYLIEHFIYIIDKNGDKVLLKLNRPQEIFYEAVCKRLHEMKPCNFIILKARQHGITTIIEALGIIFVLFRKNQSGIIMANTNENANKIFAKLKYSYENLKTKEYDLTRKLDSKTGNQIVTLDPPCSMRVAPSTMDAARGTTITFFEGSEFAFWENQEDVLAAVLEAVPPTEINPVTFIFLESTANGQNAFKDYWDEACETIGNDSLSVWVPIFIPWFKNPEYRDSVPVEESSLNEFEREKMAKHNLDLYQMAFWRKKFLSHKRNLMLTLQEYPFDPYDAFISTGSGVFDNQKLDKRKNAVRNIAYEIGFMKYKIDPINNDIDRLVMKDVEFIKSDIGYVKIFEKPQAGVPYVMGVDMAVGLGNDNSAVFIFRNDTKKQVASMVANTIAAEDFSNDVIALAYYYNDALITPEVNYGTTLIRILKKFDYENIYQREVDETSESEGIIGSYGIKTTQRNKSSMVDNFREICEDDDEPYSNIVDYSLLIEMGTFVYDYGKSGSGNGTVKIKGAGKNHDDRVMSAVLAYAGMNQQTSLVKYKSNNVLKKDWRYKHIFEDDDTKQERGLFDNYYL